MAAESVSLSSTFQPETSQVDAAHQQRASHGLLTEAFDIVLGSSPSKSDNKTTESSWGASDIASGFVKAVPLFMGQGRGMVLSAVLHGLDEVHRGDNLGTQVADFALGSAKGIGTKLLMDKVGTTEISASLKGLTIGGGSSLLNSSLTRTNWLNEKTGDFDFQGGLKKAAFQASFGAIVGGVAFPLGDKLGSRLVPASENLFAGKLSGAVVKSFTTGAAFGFTGGVVGESAHQLYSGSLDPLAIAKRGLIEGLSTGAAGVVGSRFAVQRKPERNDPDFKQTERSADTASGNIETESRPPGGKIETEMRPPSTEVITEIRKPGSKVETDITSILAHQPPPFKFEVRPFPEGFKWLPVPDSSVHNGMIYGHEFSQGKENT